jgi:phosphatidylglycerol:prolipoprotein diacylglycerol transferase
MLREINGVLTYMIVYILSMVTFLVLALWLCHHRKIPLRVGVALGLCYVWGMNMGARMLYDLLNDRFHLLNYFDLGYYMQRGMWGGPLAYLAVATGVTVLLARNKKRMLDLIILPLPLPMILAKVACFANGCCYGAPCNLPWAVTFPGGSDYYTAPPGVSRHPTQLYEILVLAAIQVTFMVLDRKRWRGLLMAWFVVLYGIGRPLTEFFRAAEKRNVVIGPLTLSEAICLTGALLAGVVLIIARGRVSADPTFKSIS